MAGYVATSNGRIMANKLLVTVILMAGLMVDLLIIAKLMTLLHFLMRALIKERNSTCDLELFDCCIAF